MAIVIGLLRCLTTIPSGTGNDIAGLRRAQPHLHLGPIYPIVYIDALMVKVRDGAVVTNKAAHLVVGVDLDGVKHVLGIWVQTAEGAKFWLQVLTELRNRGVRDVLIACCDCEDAQAPSRAAA